MPGAAHLRAGHRRTGFILVGIFAATLLGVLAFVLANLGNVGIFTRDSVMMTVVVMASLGALSWFALAVSSYVTLGPNRLDHQGQIISGIVVGLLCVVVMAPFAFSATSVYALWDAKNHVFQRAEDNPEVAPIKEEDPWNGKERVNFLLIGGDAAGNRTGVRTDSMNVASVHIPTGTTVLFSLPRNLQHVRFPPSSPLRKHFPNGFMAELANGGLLNEVWQYANDHPEQAGGKNKGPRALMDAISYTLNLDIDYYVLMNMYGFADLVDAIGGLTIHVERDIKWGGLYGTAGTIRAGTRRLSGEEALWYGRSRVGSDDFSRMGRQRCVIGAFAQQATPQKILANFNSITSATKRLAHTNIPQELVEPLVELALKVKDAKISSLQFVPPKFWPGSPDWVKIRRASAKAIQDSLKPRRATAATQAAPTGSGAPTASASPTRVRAAKPTETPTRNTQGNDSAQSLEELCG
ncbi:LCP family protein [Nonomuraea sp. NPDC048826]|uniref:LCP family protein n=1 Tax=Nonomuraea sp. NPDC048826 TaxID=3364347 RepID=UPI003716FB40